MGTPRTKALKQKWSSKEGASNSTCSEEAHEIYALAEDLEEKLAAMEIDARRYRWLRQSDCRDGMPFIATFDGRLSQWTGTAADEQVDAAKSPLG